MGLLTEPFAFAFFGRALAAGVVVGAVCGALGVFVVVRRMSYIGLGLSQSVLGGVAVSQAVGLGLYPGALGATVVAAATIDRVSRRRGLHTDAAIGLVSTALFALGVAVISASRSREFNVSNLLFGNVLGVTDLDLLLVGLVAIGFTLVLLRWGKALVFTTFDPVVARAQGVATGRIEALFNLLLVVVVVASLRVLGVLLIAAALVIPAATARLLSASFPHVLATSTLLGAAAGLVGLYVSYHADIASGPAIVLTHATVFAFVFTVTGRRADRSP